MKKRIKDIHFYMSYYRKYAKLYLVLFYLKIILSAVIHAVNSIYVLKITFDTFMNKNKISEFVQIMILVFIINTLLFCFNAWFNHMYKPKCELRIKEAIQKEIFDKAKKIDLSYYDDPEFYDRYILSLNEADEKVIQTLDHVGEIVGNVVGILTIISIIITIDVVSVLLIIVSTLISFLFNSKLGKLNADRSIRNINNNRKKEYVQRIFYLKDYLIEVKSLKNTAFIFDEYDKAAKEEIKINTKYGKRSMVFSIMKGVIESVLISYSIYIILFYKLIVIKTITVGALSAVINSIWVLTERLNNIISAIRSLYEDSVYFEAINEFQVIKNKNCGHTEEKLPDVPDVLRVSNISFSYHEKKEILHNISIEIQPGEKVAIVGRNGAGKSTLINIMVGMYRNYQGSVTIGDKDIRQINKEDLLEYYGVLFQDYNIYATTLANNVMMDIASEKKYKTIASVLELIGFGDRMKKMKNGLDQNLSNEYDPEGSELSGGEKHKVSMARVLADKSKIIFLDEPSSMLDPQNESNFNRLLMSQFNDRTVIFVSHRLMATRLVDRILMMDNGRIIESGSHEELLELNGSYAELYKIQSKKYIINEG